jgi:anti-anti-sigma factor
LQTPFELEVDGPVIRVTGEVDVETAPQLSQAMLDAADQQPLRLDFGGVSFIDSYGIRVLLERHEDTEFTLVALSPPTRRILSLGGIEYLLPIEGDD